MARSAATYLSALLALLPPGNALPRDLDTVLAAFLLAWCDGFARFDQRVDDLLTEADPRSATELLPEWEEDYGLPDPCAGEAPTIELRRAQVMARMTSPPERASQSIASFVARAAAVGFPITITEPQLWSCESACTDPLYTEATGWNFAWFVHAPETTIDYWSCLDSCIAPLASWGNELLECVINRDAPPDTIVLFAYGG